MARWNAELESSGARASHAVIEDLVKNAEWHQKQAQAYIETLTQESLAKTDGVFEARTQEISDRLGDQLAQQNLAYLDEAKRELEGRSSEVIGRTASQLEAPRTPWRVRSRKESARLLNPPCNDSMNRAMLLSLNGRIRSSEPRIGCG